MYTIVTDMQQRVENKDMYTIYNLYLGSKRSSMQVLLKRMAHSLFIIFLRVFSYFLISFILFWSFCFGHYLVNN